MRAMEPCWYLLLNEVENRFENRIQSQQLSAFSRNLFFRGIFLVPECVCRNSLEVLVRFINMILPLFSSYRSYLYYKLRSTQGAKYLSTLEALEYGYDTTPRSVSLSSQLVIT